MITEIDLLTEAECQLVRDEVYNLKDLWVQRHFLLDFYILGASSYIDGVKNQQDYYQKIKVYNPILSDSFSWLYQQLADALAKTLEAPVCYQDTLALPGFQIYLFHRQLVRPSPFIHSDLQYQLLNWESTESIDFNNPISLTLTIALPKHGAGLHLWDLQHQEYQGLAQEEKTQLLSTRKKIFHPYKLGSIALHKGNRVHQAALGKNLQTDDERITLQGHGLLCQGAWQLYW